jgi:hypothetical protein
MKRYLPFTGALLALAAFGQAPRDSSPSNSLKSPEVTADHHITFRVFAPKASDVTLTGDWLGSTPAPKLTKDEVGVWSVTLGPLEPSIYIYSFTVDGVAIPDPINPRTRRFGKRMMCPMARWKSIGKSPPPSMAKHARCGSTLLPVMRNPRVAIRFSISCTAPTTRPPVGPWPATPTSFWIICSPRRKPRR